MAVRELTGKDPREKIMKSDAKNDKKVLLMAQELKLARVLAGNNKVSRDRALKSLKKWFSHRSQTLPFTDNDFQIIWKGLYFSMWMSDKPLIQEECAENIASLIHLKTLDESLLFFKAGLTILINEWFGIDQLRLDKFLMLVRRLLRHMLVALKNHGLSKKNIDKFGAVISFTILNTDIHPPVGLFMHFTEIFLEEVAKVTKGHVPSERLVDFIRPFIKKLAATKDAREIAQLKKFIFMHLMKQSDLGLDYQAKYNAWRQEGFPGTIDSIQKIKLKSDAQAPTEDEDLDNDSADKPLDPRAGRVDVELPQLKFKAKHIADALQEHKYDKNNSSKSRKTVDELINNFKKMSKGAYPLGVKKVLDFADAYDTNIRKAANRLIKFENKLLGKDKKKRKRGVDEAEVPEKRRKANDSTVEEENDQTDEESSLSGDEVTAEELEKFILRSEEKQSKKTKKKAKKSVEEQQENINEGEDSKIEGEDSKIGATVKEKVKKTKKIEKKVETVEKSGTAEEIGDVAELEKAPKRKKTVKTNNDTNRAKKKRRDQGETAETIIDYIECIFERNSGTWVVYDLSGVEQSTETPTQTSDITTEESTVSAINVEEGPSTHSISVESLESDMAELGKSPSTSGGGLEGIRNENEAPSKNKASPLRNESIVEGGSPSSGLSPVRLFESPQKPKELFPRSPWDEPLQEGEYEICIPSKKHVAKLKRQAKKANSSVHELINTSLKQIRGKARMSLDSNLIKNPFSTPGSLKKVKINTKLNQSQEIHEHVQQILSSPGIPYDANKKPLKPLLKTSASSTPLNPFYKKQLNVW